MRVRPQTPQNEVAAPKSINRNVSLDYTPRTQRSSLACSVSGAPQSVLDPRWNALVGLTFNG